MRERIDLSFDGPFNVADLRAEKWSRVPLGPGVYRWYFPETCLHSLGVSSYCDLENLNFCRTDDGMVGLYFGIATSLSERIKWHAAQQLKPSALRSGFLSTYRLSLLALTGTDYVTGEDSINGFMDTLKVSWAITPSKSEAERIERMELAGQYHYPINIQHNNKPEVAPFVRHVKDLRRAYKARYLRAKELAEHSGSVAD